jgi:hypothetical protein
MRLRHGDRQNAPAKQQRQQQQAAQQRRRERQLQYRSYVDPLQLDDVRQILRAATTSSTTSSSLPPGLKIPPKGAPVPRQLRWYRPVLATLYSDADIATAAGMLVDTDLGCWVGPVTVASLYGTAKLTRVWRIKHTNQRLERICDTIRTYNVAPHIRRLYHGTTALSLASIIKQGLLCGSGGMFGGGIYLTPELRKAYGHTGYGGKHHYIFIADAALGRSRVMEQSDSSLGAHIWEQGCHSIAGVRGTTLSYGSRPLNFDEYVVYYRDQVQLLYLGQFTEHLPTDKK